jgi:hypothetical protein
MRRSDITREIREILMTEWDPIDVKGMPEAEDEYDRYIANIEGLLRRHAREEEVSDYLLRVEIEEMGLVDAQGGPLTKPTCRSVAASALTMLSRHFSR